MNLCVAIRRMFLGAGLLACAVPRARGDGKADPSPVPGRPALREIWVPADSLGSVLEDYPRAVPLSREQLLVLIRDANAADPAAIDPERVPPVRAVLRRARFDARIMDAGTGTARRVRVEGDLEIEAFSDAWAEVPLGLQGIVLGSARLDAGSPADASPASGRGSLRRTGEGAEGSVSLLVQGRGSHRLRLEFVLPVETLGDGSSIRLPPVDGVGEFTLHLPAGARADGDGGCAVRPDGAGVQVVTALRSVGAEKIRPARGRLNWRTPPPAATEAGALLQAGRAEALVGGNGVSIVQEILLAPALGALPRTARFVLPAEARAVRVENGGGTPRWNVGKDGLDVELPPPTESRDGASVFTVSYNLPLALDARGAAGRAVLPYLEAAGAHRVRGRYVIRQAAGVQAGRIEPAAVAAPDDGRTFPAAETEGKDFVAGFIVADLPGADAAGAPPAALTLEAHRTVARFSADADARADLQLDGAHLQRIITFHVKEGAIFMTRVILPPGETVLNVSPGAGGQTVADWRQEGGVLSLKWVSGLEGPDPSAVVLDTRADFTAPKKDAPSAFAFGAALVPEAEELTGYVAVASAPGFRLATAGGEDRLERRDGRTTPVRGEVAWFYRDNFKLELRAERRAAQTEASFTGYALPLAGAVEIHAGIDWHFSFAGVEEVKIRVPAEQADAFFFTGANIAERRRDGDVWTIRFQGERTGDYPMSVRATIPSRAEPGDTGRFHFRLPAVVPLDCVRWSGTWAVEADTDTEILFTASGTNEVDALHAPALAGYAPQRRIIGVFEFLGGVPDMAVDLDGIRHPGAGVAAAVVDRLDLETVVATSGVSRHRATIRARVAGGGFFDLRLPEGAALWSLLLDGAPVKPVGGAGSGAVRVELPGGRSPAAANTVTAVYQTPGEPWTNTGGCSLAAPSFAAGVPVVQSQWKLSLPDGYEYRLDGYPPGPAKRAVAQPSELLVTRIGLALWHAGQMLCQLPFLMTNRAVFSSSGIAAPASVRAAVPAWAHRITGADNSSPMKETGSNATPPPVVEMDLAEQLGDPATAAGKDLDPPAARLRGNKTADGGSVAGLLPLRVELPQTGQSYEFAGGGRPGRLDFRFTERASVLRRRWVLLTLGALGFLLCAAGWARPWRRTVWVALALTFFPLVLAPGSAAACNALLAGWLLALSAWGLTRFLLRPRPRWRFVAALCAGALLPGPGRAAPETPPPASPVETVIVPYDGTQPANTQQPAQYYLPYERFLALWAEAKRHRQPPAPEPLSGGQRYLLNAARYEARLNAETLAIEATLDFQTVGEGGTFVPLYFGNAQVGALTIDGAPAALNTSSTAWVPTAGAHRANVSLRLRAGPITAGECLAWEVPPTVATLVSILLPTGGLRAEIHGSLPEIGEVEEITPEGRRLTASAGGTSRVELLFREAPPPTPDALEPVLATIAARLETGTREETLRATIGFSFPGGTQDRFRVKLDGSLTLTNLDAPGIERWRVTPDGDARTLEIILQTAARDRYQLTLAADRPLPPLPAERRRFPAVSAGALRTEQTAILFSGGAVALTLPDGVPAGLRRVPGPVPDGDGGGRPFASFAGNGAELVYSVHAAAAKRTAQINYLYQLGRAKLEIAASLKLMMPPSDVPLTAAQVQIPAGFRVQAVEGATVRWWRAEGGTLSLRFRITPDRQTVPLVVYLVRQFERAPDRFVLQPLVVPGFTDVSGEAVIAAAGSFKTGLTLTEAKRAKDLEEIDPLTPASEFEVKSPLERQRAFRYRGGAFEAAATLEPQPEKWQVQWVARASVREGVLALQTHVNVQAQRGAVASLDFLLPAGVPEARVAGPDVRETITGAGDEDHRAYRVVFQNPVYANGETAFTVDLELPLPAGGRAALPPLTFPKAGAGPLAGGFLLVENASSGEMSLEADGLEPAVEKDVPFLPAQIVAGTRFFRAAPGLPWSLDIRIAGLEKTAGRAALVAYAELTSTLRPDGEEWHRAVYRLQNRRLQFLPVELPAGVEFIGARVAGESVRVDGGTPGAGGKAVWLVPLLKTRPGELSYDVELVYLRPGTDGAGRQPVFSRWRLDDPELPGVPVEKTLWNVYLPDNVRLLSSGGNLEEVVTALAETEKLESALTDLRSLSATYNSTAASAQERERALTNFNNLASAVTTKARTERHSLPGEENSSQSFFGNRNAVTQNNSAGQKQQSILNELDSLTAANTISQQQAPARPVEGLLRSSKDQRGAASGTVSDLEKGWTDNRQPAGTGEYAFNGVPDVNGRAAGEGGRAASLNRRQAQTSQLALNDSVAINIPLPDFPSMPQVRQTVREPVEKRLSTARAYTPQDADAARALTKAAGGALPATPALPAKKPSGVPADEKRDRDDAPAVGGARVVTKDAAAVPAQEVRAGKESLRSMGRISLAVDFPVEGQVYHFKKVEAGAQLTLWSVRPSGFARLGWLAVLAVGYAVVRMARRFGGRMVLGRRRVVRPTGARGSARPIEHPEKRCTGKKAATT